MTRLSRRDLLAGTGTVALAGVAGCLGGNGDEDPDSDPGGPRSEAETNWRDDLDLPESLVSALAYVYQHGDNLVLGTGRLLRGEDDGLGGPYGDALASASVESLLQYGAATTGDAPAVSVWVGEFELDPDLAVSNRNGFAVHELDAPDEQGASGMLPDGDIVVATDGGVLLAGKRDQVIAALDSHEAGEEPYLLANDRFRTVLNELAVADGVAVTDDAEALFETGEFGQSVDLASLPTPFGYAFEQGQDTVQWQFAAGTTDESVARELAAVGSSFSGLDREAFDHRVADDILVVEAARTVTPPEDSPPEGPPSLGVPRFDTYDESTGEILLRFERGESVPVDSVTIEIEGEPYDGDWARGAETVGGGSQIAIDADAVEPGDRLRITYESEDGSASTGGRQSLRFFPFEFSYDPDAGTATLTYVDGPPLSGERTDLRTAEDPLAEDPLQDGEQVRALSGGLTKGDTLTLDAVEPGTELWVAYKRTDGETIPLTGHTARPPGEFSLENNDGQLVVTRPSYRGGEGGSRSEGSEGSDESDGSEGDAVQPPEQEPLPAEHYEVRIDGEPTETQWTDQGETIDPGDTLVVGAVQAGSVASVVWVGETAEFELDSQQVPPNITVVVSYDEDDQQLTLVHDGGESVDADALSVVVGVEEERRVRSWDGDTVSPGDQLTVSEVEREAVVRLQFQGEDIFRPFFGGELAERDEMVLGGD